MDFEAEHYNIALEHGRAIFQEGQSYHLGESVINEATPVYIYFFKSLRQLYGVSPLVSDRQLC